MRVPPETSAIDKGSSHIICGDYLAIKMGVSLRVGKVNFGATI